jgi:hypothetical protein
MTDEFEQKRAAACAHFEDLMRRNPERQSAPAPVRYSSDDDARKEFEAWQAANAERAKAAQKPKPERAEPAQDWAANERWFDEKINAVIRDTVGEAIEEISTMIAGELDKESAARARLEDRVRELMLEQAKAATTIAKFEVAVAHLELRLANGDRRGGGIIDANPTLKSIN